jgi:hypothetical protein
MRSVTRIGALPLALATLLGSSCVRVPAYDRGIHAKRCMQLAPDATATALEQHVFEYREGAAGGYEPVGGSGCGCN